MDIFVSYASEQRAVAEEIALALRGEGHEVFLDRSELPEGDAYNARIREAIGDCDLLVFLVSPESVSDGRYTLTELKFAEEKWRSPVGRVLPVMVRPTDTAAMPAYLRAVVILRPAGNVSAEVVAAVDRLAKPRWVRNCPPLRGRARRSGAGGRWLRRLARGREVARLRRGVASGPAGEAAAGGGRLRRGVGSLRRRHHAVPEQQGNCRWSGAAGDGLAREYPRHRRQADLHRHRR